MAASEMAAGYVTRKSERQGKALKEPPPRVPRFLESWVFCHTASPELLMSASSESADQPAPADSVHGRGFLVLVCRKTRAGICPLVVDSGYQMFWPLRQEFNDKYRGLEEFGLRVLSEVLAKNRKWRYFLGALFVESSDRKYQRKKGRGKEECRFLLWSAIRAQFCSPLVEKTRSLDWSRASSSTGACADQKEGQIDSYLGYRGSSTEDRKLASKSYSLLLALYSSVHRPNILRYLRAREKEINREPLLRSDRTDEELSPSRFSLYSSGDGFTMNTDSALELTLDRSRHYHKQYLLFHS
ncbi:NADPH-dependent 7-cyano-7-deazaguanine reductase [Striga asiatica]|uniref:NADPH-dependent 7-cyano-7-deazaguanine reductase n=1 Tax=Striga asiatica TaxID=4170 RepID=A0A5A7PZ35_STRAF|nr:NADPH-dependent 7-cyano-7-deazaguanine reductase [Striga asiatica]